MPEVPLDPTAARRLANGIRIDAPAEALAVGAEPFRVTSEGSLFAVARVVDGRLHTDVVLPPTASD